MLQTALSGFCRKAFGPGLIADQDQIATDQLLRLPIQRQAHAIGKKPNGGDRSNRNCQRREQETQFAGAHFPTQ